MAILTDRNELAQTPASGDFVHVVDVSDTTDNPQGTSKKMTIARIGAFIEALTSYFNKSSNTSDDITEGTTKLFLTTAERSAISTNSAKVGVTNELTPAGTATVTNKRVQDRVFTVADTATLTPEIDTYDVFDVTALAQALTIANHVTSTPADGEMMRIRILDNGTARALTFGTNYVARGGVALPTTTTISKQLTLGFEWYGGLAKWNLVALAEEA